VAQEAGADVLAGSSLKAALDLNWDDPSERAVALWRVLGALEAVEEDLQSGGLFERAGVEAPVETARRLAEQDVEETDYGSPTLRRGVARERLISVEDTQMRHGRKSRSVRFCGYKRHALKDLDTGLVRAVGITLANAPEATVSEGISRDLRSQGARLSELHIDRAYLSSELVRERPAELEVFCKAWRVYNATAIPRRISRWTSRGVGCAVRRGWRWTSRSAGWCASRKRRARHAL
jgi:hypothetical protein